MVDCTLKAMLGRSRGSYVSPAPVVGAAVRLARCRWCRWVVDNCAAAAIVRKLEICQCVGAIEVQFGGVAAVGYCQNAIGIAVMY